MGHGQSIVMLDDDDIFDFASRADEGALPRRRVSVAVRVLLLAAAVGLTLGAGGLVVWALTDDGVASGPARAAHAYLIDVKDANYAQAYHRLCSQQESLEVYSARLADARGHGHRITAFRLNSAFAGQSGDRDSASGKVTFADGTVKDVFFEVQPASTTGPSCLQVDTDLLS
ncbi:MAG TPA: hypothetical protein VHX15_19760 [Frankiaceae bacterium]|jgi:hypothetical protein|nr:hypothetical protein [Frankiaceae bacterium]